MDWELAEYFLCGASGEVPIISSASSHLHPSSARVRQLRNFPPTFSTPHPRPHIANEVKERRII